MEALQITSITYMNIIKLVPSFISLDISKTSTGWIKWLNGELTYGTFSIQAEEDDEVGRRREFRDFILDLFGKDEYEYTFIEDVIGSCNFKTAKILYQINPIVDDLRDMGLLNIKTIMREDNKVWKKRLKACSGYKSDIRGETNDKFVTMQCLLALGFGDGTTDEIAEDIYDAMGMAVGTIHSKLVLQEEKRTKKLKKDISKGYKIKQFKDLDSALKRASKTNKEVQQLNFLDIKRDLKHNFKNYIEDIQDDQGVYVISILTCKIGALALDKEFDLSVEVSYLVAYR